MAELVKKLDTIDSQYVETESDEIFRRQPFFLTVLLGYRLDVSSEELEEIMKIFFLIWEYFRPNQQVQSKKVKQKQFEKIMNRNLQMLKYMEGKIKRAPGRRSKAMTLKE